MKKKCKYDLQINALSYKIHNKGVLNKCCYDIIN